LAALGEGTGRISYWDAKRGEVLQRVLAHQGPVRGADISPDGRRLATAGEDGVVLISDIATGDELIRLTPEGTNAWNCVAWSPDGFQLAVGGDRIHVWNLGDQQILAPGQQVLTSGKNWSAVADLNEAEASPNRRLSVWKSWYQRLDRLVALNTDDAGDASMQAAWLACFNEVPVDEWDAMEAALVNWLDGESGGLSAVRAADLLLAVERELSESAGEQPPSRQAAMISAFRILTQRLADAAEFDRAESINQRAIELAEQLINRREASASHWRLWESACVDREVLGVKEISIRAESETDLSVADELKKRIEQTQQQLSRIPDWARLIASNSGGQIALTRWRAALIEPVIRADLDAGRKPAFREIWLEQFRGQTYYDLYQRALALAVLDDRAAYRETCQQMVDRFRPSDEPLELGFTAWSCALLPDALNDYEPLIQAARPILLGPEASAATRLYWSALLFRAGQLEEAREQLLEISEKSDPNTSPAYVGMILGLTLFQLGDIPAAEKWLQRTSTMVDEELQPGQAVPWNRRFTLRLLQQQLRVELKE
jgi:hypothetical protein